jgi:hypothetical protein
VAPYLTGKRSFWQALAAVGAACVTCDVAAAGGGDSSAWVTAEHDHCMTARQSSPMVTCRRTDGYLMTLLFLLDKIFAPFLSKPATECDA